MWGVVKEGVVCGYPMENALSQDITHLNPFGRTKMLLTPRLLRGIKAMLVHGPPTSKNVFHQSFLHYKDRGLQISRL